MLDLTSKDAKAPANARASEKQSKLAKCTDPEASMSCLQSGQHSNWHNTLLHRNRNMNVQKATMILIPTEALHCCVSAINHKKGTQTKHRRTHNELHRSVADATLTMPKFDQTCWWDNESNVARCKSPNKISHPC